MLRKIWAKRDEMIGQWRELYNEELYDVYSSTNSIRVIKSRRMIWTGHVALMEDSRCAYRVLVVKPEGKNSLGRSRYR